MMMMLFTTVVIIIIITITTNRIIIVQAFSLTSLSSSSSSLTSLSLPSSSSSSSSIIITQLYHSSKNNINNIWISYYQQQQQQQQQKLLLSLQQRRRNHYHYYNHHHHPYDYNDDDKQYDDLWLFRSIKKITTRTRTTTTTTLWSLSSSSSSSSSSYSSSSSSSLSRFDRVADNQSSSENGECVLYIHGNWYNVTTWMKAHPGGTKILYNYHNKDATQMYDKIGHSKHAHDLLQQFMIIPNKPKKKLPSSSNNNNNTDPIGTTITLFDQREQNKENNNKNNDNNNNNKNMNNNNNNKNNNGMTKASSSRQEQQQQQQQQKSLSSSSSSSSSPSPRWKQKLFTHEDPIGIHKYLGLYCLIHFIVRYALYFVGGQSTGGFLFINNSNNNNNNINNNNINNIHMNNNMNNNNNMIMITNLLFSSSSSSSSSSLLLSYISILPHAFLSLSSLIFTTVPKERIVGKPMIWKEFRLHNICFGLRSVICTLLACYGSSTISTTIMKQDGHDGSLGNIISSPRIMMMMTTLMKNENNILFRHRFAVIGSCFICLLTMIIADISTHYYQPSKNDSTTATMPYWENCSITTQKKFKLFYAYSQFMATLSCVAVMNPIWPFCVLLAIQIASLLMTLVRKGLCTTKLYHYIYTITLMLPYFVGFMNGFLKNNFGGHYLFPMNLLLANILFYLRRRYNINKYILWCPIFVGRIMMIR